MPQVGFEPTIPVFEWAKTFQASDHAAAVIGKRVASQLEYFTIKGLQVGASINCVL
jgi:hypothetical protein